MADRCSLRMELTVTGGKPAWRLFHRTSGHNNSIDSAHTISALLNPSSIITEFRKIISRHNIADLRLWSIKELSAILPSTVQEHIDKFNHGDITFIVSPEWAEIPFELLISHGDFLCMRFQCGTIISAGSPCKDKNPNLSNGEMLVISHSPGDIPSTDNEALCLRKIGREANHSMRMLYSAPKTKTFQCMNQASIVHFAGHSCYTDDHESSGWKISGGEMIDLCDMENIGEGGSVPWLVFSNSCHAGNSGCSDELSGIAGALMKAGVSQVIGPIAAINDRDACEAASTFYPLLFKGMNPSEALFTMRKKLISKGTAPLTYRLYGDPLFRTGSTLNKTIDSVQVVTKTSISKRIVLIAALLLIFLLILFFLPFGNNNIIYLPPR